MAQDPERDQREHDKEHDSDHSSLTEDADVNKADPLEGLDEETKICFQVTICSQSLPLRIGISADDTIDEYSEFPLDFSKKDIKCSVII